MDSYILNMFVSIVRYKAELIGKNYDNFNDRQ